MYAIITETEETLPIDISGIAEVSITTAHDAVPFVCFTLALVSSAFGMAKWLLLVPIDNKPCNSLFSLGFLGTIALNLFFVVRIYCVENTLFSYYQFYPSNIKDGNLDPTVSIEPLIPLWCKHLRVLLYLLPAVVSILANLWRLKRTKASLKDILKKRPQLLIVPGFTPFMFEKAQTLDPPEDASDKLQIWKVGSIFNSVYIGIVPPISIIISEYARGITKLNLAQESGELQKFTSSSLNLFFNSSIANTVFASSFAIFAGLLTLTMLSGCVTKNVQGCKKCNEGKDDDETKITIEELELFQLSPTISRTKSVDIPKTTNLHKNRRKTSLP